MKPRMNRLSSYLPVLALLWACTLQAASGSVEMRLRALESRLPDADRMAELEKSLSSQGASLLAQDVAELKAEVRELRGLIEQLTHQVDKMQQGQGMLYEDLDKRLQALEARAASPVPSSLMPATPDTALPPEGGAVQDFPGPVNAENEQAEYLAAFELLQQGKTAEAVASFQGFLDRYPRGAYAGNALYWLGEAHYVNKNYQESLVAFGRLVQAHPDSQKIPGARLKIGFIHYETRNFGEARTVLEQVQSDYPETNVSTLAAERLEQMRKEGV